MVKLVIWDAIALIMTSPLWSGQALYMSVMDGFHELIIYI